MNRLLSIIGLSLALSAGLLALEVGDKAPAVKVGEWVNGKGVNPAEPDGKTIYVVEFWATWCPPCRTTIPHLNKLHKEFKDKGVVIMGITSEDTATVKKFMEKIKMDYNVGIDAKEGTNATYMKGISGIPHAFIVGKDGKVVWHGHPMSGLDKVLKQVLAGTYNPKVAKLRQEMQTAQRARDIKKYAAILEKIIELEPGEAGNYAMMISVMKYQRKPKAEFGKVHKAWAKGCNDSADGLLKLASSMLEEDAGDRELVLTVAKRVVALLEEQSKTVPKKKE